MMKHLLFFLLCLLSINHLSFGESFVLTKPKCFAYFPLFRVDADSGDTVNTSDFPQAFNEYTSFDNINDNVLFVLYFPKKIDIKVVINLENIVEKNDVTGYFEIFEKVGPIIMDPKFDMVDSAKGEAKAKFNTVPSYRKKIKAPVFSKKTQFYCMEWKDFDLYKMIDLHSKNDSWPYSIKIVVTVVSKNKKYISERIVNIVPGC